MHEALAPELVAVLNEGARKADRPRLAKITHDILDYHTSPVEAAEIAREVGAGHLLFTHIVPPLLLPPKGLTRPRRLDRLLRLPKVFQSALSPYSMIMLRLAQAA